MKIESRVVAVSWIPSEAVKGTLKAPFELGIAHYDEPPPDVLGDLEEWQRTPTCSGSPTTCGPGSRSTTSGTVVGHGYAGGGVIGSTTMGLGSAAATFQAVAYPDIQARARGRRRLGAVHADRRRPHRRARAPRVAKPPFVQYHAPTAWSTLSLTIHADGSSDWDLVGRQPVPPPLGLRPDGEAGGQDRPGRLQGLVPQRLRRAQPVGRRGLARAGRRGRVGHGAPAVPGDHGRGQAQGPQAQGGRRRSPSRARRPTRSTCCSTA